MPRKEAWGPELFACKVDEGGSRSTKPRDRGPNRAQQEMLQAGRVKRPWLVLSASSICHQFPHHSLGTVILSSQRIVEIMQES